MSKGSAREKRAGGEGGKRAHGNSLLKRTLSRERERRGSRRQPATPAMKSRMPQLTGKNHKKGGKRIPTAIRQAGKQGQRTFQKKPGPLFDTRFQKNGSKRGKEKALRRGIELSHGE